MRCVGLGLEGRMLSRPGMGFISSIYSLVMNDMKTKFDAKELTDNPSGYHGDTDD